MEELEVECDLMDDIVNPDSVLPVAVVEQSLAVLTTTAQTRPDNPSEEEEDMDRRLAQCIETDTDVSRVMADLAQIDTGGNQPPTSALTQGQSVSHALKPATHECLEQHPHRRPPARFPRQSSPLRSIPPPPWLAVSPVLDDADVSIDTVPVAPSSAALADTIPLPTSSLSTTSLLTTPPPTTSPPTAPAPTMSPSSIAPITPPPPPSEPPAGTLPSCSTATTPNVTPSEPILHTASSSPSPPSQAGLDPPPPAAPAPSFIHLFNNLHPAQLFHAWHTIPTFQRWAIRRLFLPTLDTKLLHDWEQGELFDAPHATRATVWAAACVHGRQLPMTVLDQFDHTTVLLYAFPHGKQEHTTWFSCLERVWARATVKPDMCGVRVAAESLFGSTQCPALSGPGAAETVKLMHALKGGQRQRVLSACTSGGVSDRVSLVVQVELGASGSGAAAASLCGRLNDMVRELIVATDEVKNVVYVDRDARVGGL